MHGRRLAILVVAGATLVASAVAIAASITGRTPDTVSVGMPFVITGDGFGTKKPKVTLIAGKKKAKVKVVPPFTDTAIHAAVTSAKPADLYSLFVGKGATALENNLTTPAGTHTEDAIITRTNGKERPPSRSVTTSRSPAARSSPARRATGTTRRSDQARRTC